ncbi:MAG: hypothetical protein Q9168_002982 [Polycauliona sp. 1 TL-2023]
MAAPGSLHAKASSVVPPLSSKPSTIIVAILHCDADANSHLQEENFLWIKCHAVRPSRPLSYRSVPGNILANDCMQKVTLGVIHQQYQNKRGDNKTPWLLKHNGKAVGLDNVVGDINTNPNNLVALEAVETPNSTQAPPSRRAPLTTGNPLSPRDPNPRLGQASFDPFGSKPISQRRDENSRPASTTAADTHNYHTRVSPGSDGKDNHHIHYNHLLPPSRSNTSGSMYAATNPLARPPTHTPQPCPMSAAAQSPYVKVPEGNFLRFRDASIPLYRRDFPRESDESLSQRLWSIWIVMRESDRARYAPQQQPPRVKTEVAPAQRQARVKTEARDSATPQARQVTAMSNTQQPTASVTTTDDDGQQHFQLPAMFKDATPQVLESAVEASVKLLATLRAPLADKMENSPDAEHWIQQIDNLSKLAVKTKTVIGVVGNTGAGKSSVINAMLEEERLVPTNCMRACTAVVTEISYNYTEQPYCAEIEFITAEEWAKELRVLFQDLLDGEGNVSRDCTNEDSDAGVAYAKIKAVYPQKTKDDISNSSIDRLLQEVSTILGARRKINETDSLMFYKKLQSFVDSKEKSTGQKDKDGKKPKKERELWPLIRVVRLYVKSPALATGAVIVDLPGKTDDISISEAQESLGLDDKMVPSWEESDRLSAKETDLKDQLEDLNNTKGDYEDVANDVDEQIEVWETLGTSVTDGKVTYPPKDKSAKKRKASPKEKSSRQKRRKIVIDDEDDDDFIDGGSENDDKDTDDEADSQQSSGAISDDESHVPQQPLTEEQVKHKLDELKATKKNARTQKREITEKVQDIKKALRELKAAEAKIKSEMSALCISGRNQYSKGAIQQDFAAGIKEIDQEIAAEEDEDNFNPENDLQGRLRKDPPVPGFTSIEETEIPALQAHCEKLTETGRTANCRAFINRLSSLLNSLTIWASSDGTGANLTAEQKAKEARYLKKGMEGLETRLEKVTKSCAEALNEELADGIYDRYETAIEAAMSNAIHTTNHWGSPVNRENRTHNFNEQLIEPMIKIIAPGWERVFTRRVGSVLNNFTKSIPAILQKFHREIEDRARKIGTGLASLSMLKHQIGVYEQVMKDAAASTKDMIIAKQKDINREFTPVLERVMQPSYEWCEAERGPGQYKRMKSYMKDHVQAQQGTMFKSSTDEVKKQLKDMVSDVEETLADKTDEVFIQIKRDYRSVLGGEDAPQGEVLPRVQRLVRKELKKTIEGVERTMKIAIGLEVENLPDAAEDEDDDTMKSDRKGKEASEDINVEKEQPWASTSNDVERETAEGKSTRTEVKHETEEPQPMEVTDTNAGSDAANDSDLQNGDEKNASSGDDNSEDVQSDAASTASPP